MSDSSLPAAPGVFYKTTAVDGTHLGIDYAAAHRDGTLITHPSLFAVPDDPGTYLSLAATPAAAAAHAGWPCRLFRVQPVGAVTRVDPDTSSEPVVWCASQARVVDELPTWMLVGSPQALAILEAARQLTPRQAQRIVAAAAKAPRTRWEHAFQGVYDAARRTGAEDTWDAIAGFPTQPASRESSEAVYVLKVAAAAATFAAHVDPAHVHALLAPIRDATAQRRLPGTGWLRARLHPRQLTAHVA